VKNEDGRDVIYAQNTGEYEWGIREMGLKEVLSKLRGVKIFKLSSISSIIFGRGQTLQPALFRP
jgi:hypothetical protein